MDGGLHAGSADYWGSRPWVNDRFFDDHIRGLVEWCDVHVPGAPRWSARGGPPTQFLAAPEVWEALLEADMPMTALIRNVATLTRVGLLVPGSDATRRVIAQLGDAERLRTASIHPIAVLAALKTYAEGKGERGKSTWTPVPKVVDALDAALYATWSTPTVRRGTARFTRCSR